MILNSMAYAQLYIVLACILRRLDFSLGDIDYKRDVEASRDCFIGEPRLDSPGLFVSIKKRDD